MYNGGFLVSNYNNLALPSVFQSLLQEFEDMFQDKEIPPIKGTEHKIYFIPRTVIPYKPAYRVNPTETKEFKGKWRSSWRKAMYQISILSISYIHNTSIRTLTLTFHEHTLLLSLQTSFSYPISNISLNTSYHKYYHTIHIL